MPIEVFKRYWLAANPKAAWYPEFGVEKFWMTGDNWKRLGPVIDDGEYRVDNKAWRVFTNGVIQWTDGQGAVII